jgi:hypothetical protein
VDAAAGRGRERENYVSEAVPSKEDEATRDMLRCRGDLMDDLKRAKQRLLKFLLRHGINYETTYYWTGKHFKWLDGLKARKPL